MDLGSVFAVALMVAISAVWIVVPVVLWRMPRRLRTLEDENEAHNANPAPSSGRGRHRP